MNIISPLARLSLLIGTLLPAALVFGADISHCKNIGDPSARLACYDQAVGVVDEILQDQAVAADEGVDGCRRRGCGIIYAVFR